MDESSIEVSMDPRPAVPYLSSLALLVLVARGVGQPLPAQRGDCEVVNFDRWGPVSTPTRYLRGPKPTYPPLIRNAAPDQWVVVRFAVCRDGRPDSSSITVVRSSDARFNGLATDVVVRSRYRPATLRGQPIADIVEQIVRFRRRLNPTVRPMGT